jgi:hypothetical protein
MKRMVLGAAVLALGVTGAGVSLAANPGPNGSNDYGLCQAYSSGSQTGQDHKHQAPPFVALEQAASAQNQTVEQYCSAVTPGGK